MAPPSIRMLPPERVRWCIRVAASVALFGVALAAGADLLSEHAVATSQRALTESFKPQRGDVLPIPSASASPAPRTLVNQALLTTRAAASLPPGPRRSDMIETAVRQAELAAAARPFWAEAVIAAAFAHSLIDTPYNQRRAAELVATSYIGAPFLRDAGAWRIGYVIDHWDRVAEPTRNDAIEESFWLANVDPVNGPLILSAVGESAAAAPFLAKSRALTSAALRSRQGPTPD
jgi:hypothetical protein